MDVLFPGDAELRNPADAFQAQATKNFSPVDSSTR